MWHTKKAQFSWCIFDKLWGEKTIRLTHWEILKRRAGALWRLMATPLQSDTHEESCWLGAGWKLNADFCQALRLFTLSVRVCAADTALPILDTTARRALLALATHVCFLLPHTDLLSLSVLSLPLASTQTCQYLASVLRRMTSTWWCAATAVRWSSPKPSKHTTVSATSGGYTFTALKTMQNINYLVISGDSLHVHTTPGTSVWEILYFL